MTIKLYSIYNKSLKQYYSPIMDYDIENVKRNLHEVLNSSSDNYLKNCPANFAVYYVGEFDSKTGKIDSYKPKIVLELNSLLEVESGN